MALTWLHDVTWAEPVPGAPFPMSEEEFERLPEDDSWLYELVEGRLVRMPHPGGGHGLLTFDLSLDLGVYVRSCNLGRVFAAETGFLLTPFGATHPTELAPDISFIRADRLPQRDSGAWYRPWRMAPDLVVEVASPSQRRAHLADKARLWLAYGVRLVWVVWPKVREVDVWREGSDEPIQTLRVGDNLDGQDVVPGFAYSLAGLFR